jgi:hypothetical protein
MLLIYLTLRLAVGNTVIKANASSPPVQTIAVPTVAK